jgi:hypothetical protein
MKREKKLTKRERKAAEGKSPSRAAQGAQHIHCIACGRHLDLHEFDDPPKATMIVCKHGSSFPSCVDCESLSRKLVAEHDETGGNVKSAPAWH